MSSHTQERRRHPRLPLHLNVAKMVDFKCEGLDQPAPAVLIDIAAGGVGMVCFALPQLAKNITFNIDLPGLVKAKLQGKIVRAVQKGDTYRVAIEFTEFQEQWSHMVSKLIKSQKDCEERWNQGDRHYCPKECSFHRVFPKIDPQPV